MTKIRTSVHCTLLQNYHESKRHQLLQNNQAQQTNPFSFLFPSLWLCAVKNFFFNLPDMFPFAWNICVCLTCSCSPNMLLFVWVVLPDLFPFAWHVSVHLTCFCYHDLFLFTLHVSVHMTCFCSLDVFLLSLCISVPLTCFCSLDMFLFTWHVFVIIMYFCSHYVSVHLTCFYVDMYAGYSLVNLKLVYVKVFLMYDVLSESPTLVWHNLLYRFCQALGKNTLGESKIT